jgi:hypothetical protein
MEIGKGSGFAPAAFAAFLLIAATFIATSTTATAQHSPCNPAVQDCS